jgi:hypothetical protein
MNTRSQRIVIAAAQAVIDEARATPAPRQKTRRKLSTGRAVLLGAGLMTAGKVVAGPRARQLLGGLADRVEELEARFTVGGSESE